MFSDRVGERGARLHDRFNRAMEIQINRILDPSYSFEALFAHIQRKTDFEQASFPIEVVRDPDVRKKIEQILIETE